ncbi:hypothetical protein QTP88_027061 [Uroleucon formosanum]
MSNSGSNDSVNLDLIDLDSSSSDPSSGEFYEPSSSVLRRARVTIEQTDELLGSTRYLLRNRATNLHSEHQQSTEHPEPQSNQENTEHPEPQLNQKNTEHPEPQSNQENTEHPEPQSNQENTEHPEPQLNQKNTERPEPQLNQKNTEHPEPQSNKKNQQYSENTEHQKNPKLQIRKMSDQQDPVASDYKAEAHKGGVSIEAAMRVVPNFDGTSPDQADHFLRACDFAVRIVDPEQIDILVQGLIIKLSGRALRSIRYKEITTYQEFRKNIVEISGTKKLLPQLHMKLLTCRKSPDEGVQEYYNKMEQLLHDLINATMEGGDYANGTDIDRLLHNQVLNAFISGLPESYRILLKARGPKKLSDALVFALEEETEENLAKETQLFSMQTNTRNQQQSSKSKTGTSQPGSSSKNNNTNKGCFKCGRTNHFAKDCRAPQWDQDRFKASQQKGQQSSKNTEKTVLICRYCKKQGHELEECRKRKYVNKKKEQEKKAGTETHNAGNGEEPSTTSACSVQQIQSACVKEEVRLLVDTGSDVNMIKLSELKKDILVDETTVYKLTGINSQPVYTIGSVVLRIQLGMKDTTAVFQVTHDNFPIAEAGILGAPFLRDNEININFRTSTLSIDSPNHPEPRESIPTITLQPRSETLVPVLTDVEDRTTLIIHSQNIGKKGILMGNVVNHVRGGQVLVSVINPSGDLIEFFPPQLRDVQHDILKESVYPCNHTGEQQEEDSRIARLTRVIQTEHLNSEERASLLRICKKYQDIFHFEGEPLSFTTAIQHDIKTPEGTAPVNIRPYRLPYAHRQVIVEQMEKLEQENIIQPSESPWNAPLVVVPKKPDANGKPQFRVCVDFRRLNQLTIGDAFPIPRIDEILDQLGRSRYYTTLDLASGYHQVPIRPQDCEKTGFSTDKGHFEFVRMPFGLCGAPSTFQRLMNNVLTGLNGTKAFVYLDDIIIYAVDLVQHEARLEEVFQRLREFNLQLQPSKCQFLRHEVVYLGHLITDAGVKPDPTKISCVRDHPVPRNPTEIKRFLGLSGYYRRFIEKYSQIAKPMTTLLKKGQPFEWTAECQTSFETLVQKLVTAPILQYPNFEEPFILTTDASQYAIGSIISQGEIGHDLPIAYASRTLNKAEQNYSTTEKELLSIVWSVKHFRPYLLGRKFRIYTDHQPLTWLFNVKDPGSRLMRWRLKLAEYQYEVIYKPGVTNTNADALSRMGRVMLNSTSTTYIQMNFDTYLELVKDKTVVNNKVIEETGDLFDAPLEYSLAHCVSQDLKMNLAVGTALPLEIKAESLTGFLQVSDLTIFHREHYLVFSIEIPLTSVEEYTMYHPIPLPIIYNENTIALISPEVDYLALSNDDENFISLGVSQWEECTKLGSYTLCKGDQPIHYRAGSNLCELSHLISLESPLKDCGVKLVTLEAPIWHRLSKVNSWLYYTQRELCTIMCPDPPQTFRVEISGVGRLTVSPSCEIHTENSILVPFSKTNRDIKLDLIPENQKFNIKSMLTETLSSVLPQTLSNVKIFNNLNSLAHKALELSKLEPKSIEPLFIFKIEFHITILYISLTFFVLVISALAIRFRNRVTKMYTPEVAENISNNDQDGL